MFPIQITMPEHTHPQTFAIFRSNTSRPLSAIMISQLVPTRTRKSTFLVIINLRQVPRPFLGRYAKGEAQGNRAPQVILELSQRS